MRLKHGKKYETADGAVYRVVLREIGISFEFAPEDVNQWQNNGTSISGGHDLIRRQYTKPKPSHKLDLKPGDFVKLVAWEDGDLVDVGECFEFNELEIPSPMPKGERPLFKVVSRPQR
jgi:hypothetical protein